MTELVDLPFPHKILWPNGRGHHMLRHRQFQKHKEWAYHAALAAGLRSLSPARVRWSATFYPKTRHEIDDDNARASLKAYQDGIAAALGVNDKVFEAPTIRFAEPARPGKVVIAIEPEGEL